MEATTFLLATFSKILLGFSLFSHGFYNRFTRFPLTRFLFIFNDQVQNYNTILLNFCKIRQKQFVPINMFCFIGTVTRAACNNIQLQNPIYSEDDI